MDNILIGIDLGTTNSLVGVWEDKQPKLIANALGHLLTPSVVGIDDDGTILVGEAAQQRLLTHPHLTIANFKRYMGTEKNFQLGKQKYCAQEISALLLKQLKSDAEHYLGQPIHEAIISVPAYFNDLQRKATREAGLLAGLKVERLINEPTAAGLAYRFDQKTENHSYLVFDLGGGTLDVSVVEVSDNVMEIRASTGDNYLGGEDFTDLLVQEFFNKTKLAEVKAFTKNQQQYLAMIHERAEQAKKSLSSKQSATITITINDIVYAWTFSEADFAMLAKPLLDKIRYIIERAIQDSKLAVNDINAIILAGGSSRLTMIKSLVAKLFKNFPLFSINPDEAIALGAVVLAALKSRHQDLEEMIFVDVCPYTLGTACSESDAYGNGITLRYIPIIERNVAIPTSRSQQFIAAAAYQNKISFPVYQGESSNLENNILIGELHHTITPQEMGKEIFELRFTYDINGLLEVESVGSVDGNTNRVIIENCANSATPEEIEARLLELAKLKMHPRKKAENTLLLKKLDRYFVENTGQNRQFFGEMIRYFQSTLETQDEKAIEKVRNEINEILLSFEPSPCLT